MKPGVAPTDRVTKDTVRSREKVSSGDLFAFSDAMGYPFFKYWQYTKAFAVSTKCRKVEWGYGRILVRDGANAGWINYMLKDRQKSEFDGFVDCIIIKSLHNRVLQRQQERRKDTSRKAT